MSIEQNLERILAINDAKEQTSKFQTLINELISVNNPEVAIKFINRLMSDEVSQAVARVVVLFLAKAIQNLKEDNYEEVANTMLMAIKQHVLPFDEAEFIIRETLFTYYVKMGMFKDAAQTLSGINVDSTVKVLSDEEKTDIHVRCAEASLEEDDTIDAEVFLNRASTIINTISNWALLLRYRVTYARVLDANRKFVDAAMRYYDISNIQNSEVDPEDLLELLGKAVTCAVLGKAGPQRSRVLGLLYKDERIRTLELIPKYSGHSAILTKMFTNQLLRREELTAFEASLMKHQTAVSGDGLTIPERAVIEHNMVATGKIYDNIRFEELASLLRLDTMRAEKVAARMISEDRLNASIDQTEGILQFEDDADALLSWDARIGDVCAEVSECVDSIRQLYPELSS